MADRLEEVVSNDCLGLPERAESVLGRGSPVPLAKLQPFLPESDFFFERFEESSTLSRGGGSSPSSSQGAGEWKRILGPYILMRGISSSSTSSSGEEPSSSWRLLYSAEDLGSSSRSRLLAVGMLRRSLSEMGERGSDSGELLSLGLWGKRKG